jgi:hypothetical protein
MNHNFPYVHPHTENLLNKLKKQLNMLDYHILFVYIQYIQIVYQIVFDNLAYKIFNYKVKSKYRNVITVGKQSRPMQNFLDNDFFPQNGIV